MRSNNRRRQDANTKTERQTKHSQFLKQWEMFFGTRNDVGTYKPYTHQK